MFLMAKEERKQEQKIQKKDVHILQQNLVCQELISCGHTAREKFVKKALDGTTKDNRSHLNNKDCDTESLQFYCTF